MNIALSFRFIRKLFAIVFVFNIVIESAVSARSTDTSAESAGTIGSSSQVQSSSHHHRGDRERLSAQYRASQDDRDLDTSESSVSLTGMENLSAAAVAAGLEDDPLALTKYMAASASASKIAGLNGYSKGGFYNPYANMPAQPTLNSVPGSYYPYSSYRDTNPMLEWNYERDRLRELREKALQAAQSAPYSGSSSRSYRDVYSGGGGGFSAGNFREGYRSNNYDSTAMSSGHPHGHEGHGGHEHEEHGHGWGSGSYPSKVNTNGVGLLGLLGLLSLLSNVLRLFTTTTTTTTTAAAGRRKKRSLVEDEAVLESREEKRERIFMEILPHLTPIAHARDGYLPLACTFNGVCMANRVLVDEFGVHGRAGGIKISSAIVKLLEKVSNHNSTDSGKIHASKPADKPGKYSYNGKKAFDIRKRLESAGLDGRNKKDCQKLYPVCEALQMQVMPNFPFTIRMQDLPELIIKANKLTSKQTETVPMKL